MVEGNVAPEQPAKSMADKIAEFKATRDELDRQERKTGPSGAVPYTPKQMMLNADEVRDQNPSKHLRWVNVAIKEKVQMRESQGYERIAAAEGGRQVGNLALFALERQEYDRRVAQIKQITKDRLSAHKSEVERMAEGVARELRDKHGINVDAERILWKE